LSVEVLTLLQISFPPLEFEDPNQSSSTNLTTLYLTENIPFLSSRFINYYSIVLSNSEVSDRDCPIFQTFFYISEK
jgi:hypothetical protein